MAKEAALLSFESTECYHFDLCADHSDHIMILIAETLSVSIAANGNAFNTSAAAPRTQKDTYFIYFLFCITIHKTEICI